MTRKKIRFSQIKDAVQAHPGIYEIHTTTGIALKVGISEDIQIRLLQHQRSKQSRLRLKPGGNRANPDHVHSKQSVLAKHLYYDTAITTDYDLKTETGRQAFLGEKCFIVIEYTKDKLKAREQERKRESNGGFRYVGKVIRR